MTDTKTDETLRPICTGPFADAYECPVHGPLIRAAAAKLAAARLEGLKRAREIVGDRLPLECDCVIADLDAEIAREEG